MPPHTCARLLRCSNLGSHLPYHQPLTVQGGHPGTSLHPLLPIYAALTPAARSFGMPWDRDVDLGLADPAGRLEHHCTHHHIQLSILPTLMPLQLSITLLHGKDLMPHITVDPSRVHAPLWSSLK